MLVLLKCLQKGIAIHSAVFVGYALFHCSYNKQLVGRFWQRGEVLDISIATNIHARAGHCQVSFPFSFGGSIASQGVNVNEQYHCKRVSLSLLKAVVSDESVI